MREGYPRPARGGGARDHNACSTTLWGYVTHTADVGLDPLTLRNPDTGTVPAVLHMPGCLDLNPFCDRLGLPRGVARHPLVYVWTNHPSTVLLLLAGAALLLLLLLVVVFVVVRRRRQRRRVRPLPIPA